MARIHAPGNAAPTDLALWRDARLATLTGSTPWGWIEHGALLVKGEHLVWAGEQTTVPDELARHIATEHSVGGALITPGLVDCHTHLIYGGQRARAALRFLAGLPHLSGRRDAGILGDK